MPRPSAARHSRQPCPATRTPWGLEQGTGTGCGPCGSHTCLQTGCKTRRGEPFGTCGRSYSNTRSHAWGTTGSSQGCYCAAEGGPAAAPQGLHRSFLTFCGERRDRPRRPCSTEGARGRRGSRRHSPPPSSPQPRRAAPRAGRRLGKDEQRASGLSQGPGPRPRRGARATLSLCGGAALPPAPPRQPSAGRCRSGSGKPRPPPRVWRGWAHPRHCLRGGPCLLWAPAGGAAAVAAMLKGCAPPQRRQRAPALGSSHPAC